VDSNEVLANHALEHLSLTKGKYDFIFKNDHINKYQSTNTFYSGAMFSN
jgi:aspartate ammonia-lyase